MSSTKISSSAPSLVYGTNTKLLGTYSELVDDSTFLVRTRRTLKGEKLLVDVTEIYPEHSDKIWRGGIDADQARQAARHFGASNTDFSILYYGIISDRKVTRSDGTVSLVKIRRSAFAFQGVK